MLRSLFGRIQPVPQQHAYLRTFAASLGGFVLLWLAFPPIGGWWLAWIAPIPLVWLIAANEFPIKRKLDNAAVGKDECGKGRRTSNRSHYWMLYLAGLAYWLGTFYFIPFPHPVLWLGWLAISLYMAMYTPMFVGASRILVHRYRIPIGLAVPAVGTGLEWFRSVFLTGMPMVCLSHTQYRQPALIQVADLSGAYTLTFAIYLVAVGFAMGSLRRGLALLACSEGRINNGRQTVAYWVFSVLIMLSIWGYGQIRLNSPTEQASKTLRVALIQSSIDVVFGPLSEEEQFERDLQYWELTKQALRQWPDLDLIIWPESSFPGFDLLSDYKGESNYSESDSALAIAEFWERITNQRTINLLVGGTTLDPVKEEMFASTILIEPPGKVTGRYFKKHLVMFGEYVPLADRIPLLQNSPLGKGINAGETFESFEINGVRLAPCICFESAVPHLIRRMVRSLDTNSHAPDILINQTNDGWFFGSSCLDLHLACNVFRAVEMRKPMLVCANTGFSADIDSWGQLKQIGPRRAQGILRVDVKPVTGLFSLYLWIGDLFPLVFGVASVLVLLIEIPKR